MPRLTTAGRTVVLVGLAGAAACGQDAPNGGARDSTPAQAAAQALDMDSVARVQRAESLAIAQNRWNAIEVVSALEQAGLVVRNLETPVRAPGFTPAGHTYAVSGGELVVFLYDDAAARAAETATLDSVLAAPRGTPTPWDGRAPRLITSGNLVAVLFTDRGQLAERVRNVLTARHGG